ncbi:MAG TPA: DUF6475 domain-containing protein [Burkholderiaceae bacterium]|nr:DUF6475 domain-containing protein [Burkholderiaceae bacterium]
MRREDFRRFGLALSAVAELHGKAISEGAMTLWWQALQRFEIEQVEAALRRCVEDPDGGQYMPKPADLIKRLDGTATDRSLIAWGKVLDAMQRVGAYASVAFDDPAIHAAIVDIGGWTQACRGEVAELPFLQRRFCDAHKAYSSRGGSFDYPARLVGAHEADNALRGHTSAAPVLIGDAQKAKQVLLNGVIGSKTQITHVGEAVQTMKRIGAEP